MYCTVCDKHIAHCTCPDIEERLKSLADSPASIAVAQNLLEREAAKKKIKPEDN